MSSQDSYDSDNADFYQDDQALQIAKYFTGNLVARQRNYLLKLNESDVSELVLNTIATLQPDHKNELLYTSIIIKQVKQLDEARLPKLLDIVLAFENSNAKAAIVQLLLREHQDIESLKKYLKQLKMQDAKFAALVMRGQTQQFIYTVHSSLTKQLLTHFEFCTEGKGCPLWERSGKQHSKQKTDLISMLFTERIAIVFSTLITSCDKMLENSVFSLFEIYVNEMIMHRQNFPGILYLLNLMAASFKQYFPAQSTLYEMLRQAYKPLPHFSFSVNIGAYRGKMFDAQGRMRFLEVVQHPAGLVESSQWASELRSEIIRSIYIYYLFVCGIEEKDPLKLIALPEAINWLHLQVSQLNEALSGGCPFPGTNKIVSYCMVQKQELSKYQRQLKMLKQALAADCEAVQNARKALNQQELKALFFDGKVPRQLASDLADIATKSAIAAEYAKYGRPAFGVDEKQEVQPQVAATEEGADAAHDVFEESFEAEETYLERSHDEKPDEIRDLKL